MSASSENFENQIFSQVPMKIIDIKEIIIKNCAKIFKKLKMKTDDIIFL